jgi:hypothetical protein
VPSPFIFIATNRLSGVEISVNGEHLGGFIRSAAQP